MHNVYIVKPTLVIVAEDEHKAEDYTHLALINQLQEWRNGFGETITLGGALGVDFPEGTLLWWGISSVAKVGD